jgi:hypothetical protein
MILLIALLVALLSLEFTRAKNPRPHFATLAASLLLSAVLAFSGIGCGAASSSSGSTAQTAPGAQTAATPAIQPAGGAYGGPQTVSISDSTAAATIYYTTDGSTPTTSSPVYTASFSVNSVTTVQAMAAAANYSNSSVATAAYTFRTPAGTYPLTINITATSSASSGKALQLAPITLTLIVN